MPLVSPAALLFSLVSPTGPPAGAGPVRYHQLDHKPPRAPREH